MENRDALSPPQPRRTQPEAKRQGGQRMQVGPDPTRVKNHTTTLRDAGEPIQTDQISLTPQPGMQVDTRNSWLALACAAPPHPKPTRPKTLRITFKLCML